MKDKATPDIISQILTYCLQGGAKAWLQMFVTMHKNAHQQDPEYCVVRAAFLTQFARVRSPNDVWKELCKIQQKNGQDVDQYLIEFGRLWSLWCEALISKVARQMIKRDRFVAGLEPIPPSEGGAEGS